MQEGVVFFFISDTRLHYSLSHNIVYNVEFPFNFRAWQTNMNRTRAVVGRYFHLPHARLACSTHINSIHGLITPSKGKIDEYRTPLPLSVIAIFRLVRVLHR
jgi:hypothetical protein